MESLASAFAGKRVFVTGHTGFKGSWLCEWLLALGAEITGYSLPPPTHPSLFEELGLAPRLRHVIGAANVLEALRQLRGPCAAVFVTTDKCYENKEWLHSYREEDPLGGYDPYSSSKACAEIAIASFRRSFFKN